MKKFKIILAKNNLNYLSFLTLFEPSFIIINEKRAVRCSSLLSIVNVLEDIWVANHDG